MTPYFSPEAECEHEMCFFLYEIRYFDFFRSFVRACVNYAHWGVGGGGGVGPFFV